MLRLSRYGIRLVVRNNVRSYRKRRLLVGSHIPSLNTAASLGNEKVMNIDAKGPHELEKTLKNMGFQEVDTKECNEDLLLKYLKHINPTFKKSSKNLGKLQKELNTGNLDDDSKLSLLFDYLIEESELEIRRLETMNLNNLKSKYKRLDYQEAMDKPIESEEKLEESLMLGIFSPPSDGEEMYLTNTDFVYHILTDLNNKNDPEFFSIEQLVKAFELAKLVPIEGRRKRGIFLAGNLIYSSGKVRMDPVNESFYIDALVNYGLYKKAYNLFETNKEKIQQRWWYEMGMMIALRANYLRKFDKLLSFVDAEFNGYPYISPKVLKLAIKKKLFIRDFLSANSLTDRFVQMTKLLGCRNFSELKEDRVPMITFQSESNAEEFLNETELPTDHDLINIIEYHLFRKNYETAFKLMAQYLERPGATEGSYKFLIIQMKLYLLKAFNLLSQNLEHHLASDSAKQLLGSLENSFHEVVAECIVDPSECQDLLFESIAALAADSTLRSVVHDSVTKNTIHLLSNDDKTSLSKRFHCLLKILLASNKELEASKILSKMEEACLDSRSSEKDASDKLFAEANAHHYAEFIEYYTIMTLKSSKKKSSYYEQKVSDVLKRMENLKIPSNGVLLTRALIFYRESNNFNECFKIINELLRFKGVTDPLAEANRTNLYNRRDITRPLYVEIWKAYSKYFKVFTKELERVEKKSNYTGWKVNIETIVRKTKVHPECSIRTVFLNMIHDDNILPDVRMYYIILLAFMRRRDWPAIPAVLTAMSKVHGLEVPESFVNYFMKGLEREFILLDRKWLESKGMSSTEAKAKSKETLQEYKKSGKLQIPTACQQNTTEKLVQQMQLLLQSTESDAYSDANISAATKEMRIVENIL